MHLNLALFLIILTDSDAECFLFGQVRRLDVKYAVTVIHCHQQCGEHGFLVVWVLMEQCLLSRNFLKVCRTEQVCTKCQQNVCFVKISPKWSLGIVWQLDSSTQLPHLHLVCSDVVNYDVTQF